MARRRRGGRRLSRPPAAQPRGICATWCGPAIVAGARATGRDPAEVNLVASVFIVTDESKIERAEAESYARQQIAFCASTPTYRPFVAYHGFEALDKELSGLARDGRFADMAAHIPDALLDAIAVSAEPAGVGEAIRARYAGIWSSASTPTR